MLAAAARNDALDVVAIELAARPCECSAPRAVYRPVPGTKKQVTLSFKGVEERRALGRLLAVQHPCAPRRAPGRLRRESMHTAIREPSRPRSIAADLPSDVARESPPFPSMVGVIA